MPGQTSPTDRDHQEPYLQKCDPSEGFFVTNRINVDVFAENDLLLDELYAVRPHVYDNAQRNVIRQKRIKNAHAVADEDHRYQFRALSLLKGKRISFPLNSLKAQTCPFSEISEIGIILHSSYRRSQDTCY